MRSFKYHVNMVDITDARSAIEHLYFAYRGFTAGPDQLLESRGLGRVHHRILYFVGQRPTQSVGDLLNTLGVSKQALNAPLRRLVEAGLIEVQPAPSDKRIRLLSLTPAGLTLETQLSDIQTQLIQDAFRKAGADAQEGWFKVMAALAGSCGSPFYGAGDDEYTTAESGPPAADY